MRIMPPLRKITVVGSGCDTLECGHIIDHRSGGQRRRCVTCLPLDQRLAYIAAKRKRR